MYSLLLVVPATGDYRENLHIHLRYTHTKTRWPIIYLVSRQVQPIDENDRLLQGTYVRSGLLGFVGEGGLLFVCGKMNGLIQIAGRRHNTEDLIATVMAVEPHGFINKGRLVGYFVINNIYYINNRIAIFSVPILKEERVVVVAEQKPNCTDETVSWLITSYSLYICRHLHG